MIRILTILLLFISSHIWSQQEFEICDFGITWTYSTELDMPGYVEWSLNGNPIGSGDSIQILFDKPGNYQLVAIGYNQFDCPGVPQLLNILVTQCDPIYWWLPNSFTPDGDELNNQWGPVLSTAISEENFRLSIYNRWGQIIWECYDPGKKWDGTYGGIPVQQGVYTWEMLIQFKEGGRKTILGHVNVIR